MEEQENAGPYKRETGNEGLRVKNERHSIRGGGDVSDAVGEEGESVAK